MIHIANHKKERAKKDGMPVHAKACKRMLMRRKREKEKENITSPTPQGEAEQSESLKVEKAKGTAKAVNHSRPLCRSAFKAFWEAYPKKEGQGRRFKSL